MILALFVFTSGTHVVNLVNLVNLVNFVHQTDVSPNDTPLPTAGGSLVIVIEQIGVIPVLSIVKLPLFLLLGSWHMHAKRAWQADYEHDYEHEHEHDEFGCGVAALGHFIRLKTPNPAGFFGHLGMLAWYPARLVLSIVIVIETRSSRSLLLRGG